MKNRTLAPLSFGAALSVLAAPGVAEAATVAPKVPCVRAVPGINNFPVVASGFPANASLTFRADGAVVGSAQADGSGSFDTGDDPFFPPTLPARRNLHTFQLTAEDGAGTAAGPVPVQVTRILVDIPSRARPRQRVRYRVFGFETGRPVYLHVRRRGRTLGRFGLGTAAGPCGLATRRLRFMPLRRYRTGTYEYWFSHSRRFSRAAAVYRIEVSIFRRLRFTAAQV